MEKCKLLSTLSYFLVFAILITGLPVWAHAASNSESDPISVLSVDDVPEVMSYTELTAAGYISRVYADESELNTVVFENADSTRTAYILDENVKYFGSDGKVYDKSNHLTRSSDGTYKNLKNDISVTYPAKITDGITLQYKDIEIVITPQSANNVSLSIPLQTEEIDFTKKQITDTITYTGAFGANTSIEYIQTFTGFKENIYLASNPASNVFNFTVVTNGASIELRDGIAVLISGGEVVGDFGKVYVYDANGADCFGETIVTAAKPNQLYVLSIVVPTDFLESTETQYPVVVDPSVTLRDSTVKIVEDATVFENYSTNVGGSPYLFVGNLDGSTPFYDRGLTYTAVKFPLLGTHAGFRQLYNAGRIESVKYNFADVDCTNTNTIRAKMITVNWSENTVVYSTVANHTNDTKTSDVSITSRTATTPYPRYELEILDFIEYYGTTGIAEKGILLGTTNTAGDTLSIGASESGDLEDDDSLSSSKPYVTYTYFPMPTDQSRGIFSGQTFMIINNATGKAISYNNNTLSQAMPEGADTKQHFTITYVTDDEIISLADKEEYEGTYRISPVNNSGVSLVNSGSGLSTATNAALYSQYWYVVPTDGGYRIHSFSSENKVINTNASTSTLTASNDIDGSVWSIVIKPLRQNKDDTCGAASVRMLLSHYGIEKTESEIISQAKSYVTGNYDPDEYWNTTYNLWLTINYFLGSSIYQYKGYDNNICNTEAKMFKLIKMNISRSAPVIMNIKLNNSNISPFFYDSNGHYVVIVGAFCTEDDIDMVVVLDPYDDNYNPETDTGGPNVYVMPFATLYSVKKNDRYIIFNITE